MIVLAAIWFIAISAVVLGAALSRRHFRSAPPHLDAPFGLFPVSILKPLKGADAGLAQNLESFFTLDYPDYEILFSVESAFDPACPIVERLIERYPHVRARLFVGETSLAPTGINPKVNNLLLTYESCRHDVLLISDSNVRVPSDYLKRMVAHLDASVGIVTSVVRGTTAESFGAELEQMYLNTFYARGMLVAKAFDHPCVIGKSMLFRKSVAARFGGLRVLSDFLAEDYMAGEAMRRLGLQIEIAADPVPQILGRMSVRDFWLRHVRWGRIRKTQAPLPFMLESFNNLFISGICGALAWSSTFHISALFFLIGHCALWLACDLLTTRAMHGARGKLWIGAWLMREACAFPLWVHIMLGNTVQWRGQTLRLKAGGVLVR